MYPQIPQLPGQTPIHYMGQGSQYGQPPQYESYAFHPTSQSLPPFNPAIYMSLPPRPKPDFSMRIPPLSQNHSFNVPSAPMFDLTAEQQYRLHDYQGSYTPVTLPPLPVPENLDFSSLIVPTTQSSTVLVPTVYHERTDRLINKINLIATPHLTTDLRPALYPERENETYESLKAEWRANQSYYPPTYAENVNCAIQEADLIVRSGQARQSRRRTLFISLLVLSALVLVGAMLKDRFVIDPTKMGIAKAICKVIAAVKFIQLGFAAFSHANAVFALQTQMYITQAEREKTFLVGDQN